MDVCCPNCEFRCPEEAKGCPQCGHPLQKKEEEEEGFEGEIGALRILGLVMLVVGILIALFGMSEGMEVIIGGGILAFAGFLTRVLGGIWATLEHIARK